MHDSATDTDAIREHIPKIALSGQKPFTPIGCKVRIIVTIHVARLQDFGNPQIKAIFDGLIDAGIFSDDSPREISTNSTIRQVRIPPGWPEWTEIEIHKATD